jgi:hypothetical protein
VEAIEKAKKSKPPALATTRNNEEELMETESDKKVIDNNNSAFQELYELTQRKFLKQLAQFSERMSTTTTSNKPYPRLFCLDCMPWEEFRQIQNRKKTILNQTAVINNNNNKREETDLSLLDTAVGQRKESSSTTTTNKEKTNVKCLRVMCEYEEGWHVSESFVVLNDLSTFSSYLARVMNILRSGNHSSELKIFFSDEGNQLLAELNARALTDKVDMAESYISLRSYFISQVEKGKIYHYNASSSSSSSMNDQANLNKLDLKICEMKSGKQAWMCDGHIRQTNASLISADGLAGLFTLQNDLADNKMLEDIEQIKIDII